MFQSREHHVKGCVCLTRPPYRNGRKQRAVKVYTIAQESKYLLIQHLPSIAGALEQLLPHLNQNGPVEQYWRLDGYESKDAEPFFDTVLVRYRQIEHARRSKSHFDDWNFLGANLHVCYAPECESIDDLREKMQERRTIVQQKSVMNKNLSGKIRRTKSSRIFHQPTTLIPKKDVTSLKKIDSQSFKQTTNEIRAKMRELVQKSNLIPLVLQQETKKRKRLQI